MPLRILSLGAGEQSTALYFMAALGEIPPIDYAIFADTGEEPSWVYQTVKAIQDWRNPETGRPGATVLVRWLTDENGNQVRLGDQLIKQSGRFASIPAFIKHLGWFVRGGKNAQGKGRRQCTREFKTRIVEQTIRRDICGLKPGQPYKGPKITQIIGFDRSETDRVIKVQDRYNHTSGFVAEFPLWHLEWTRVDCRSFLAEVPGWGRETHESACVFCPLVNNRFRRKVRDFDPAGHARACQVDAGMRDSMSVARQGLNGELYVHRDMIPLAEVDLDKEDEPGQLRLDSLWVDCEGICGH